MTSVELGQRLMTDLDIQDLSLLTANSRMSILDAMNAGIQLFHAHGPSHWKRVPSSVTLRAPELVEITVTKYSSTFSGYEIKEDDLFCSILIPGDKVYHQIIGPGELLDDFLGESGTYTATIYHDAVAIYDPVERLATPPKILGGCNRQLERDDAYRHREEYEEITRNGEPDCYWLEPNARNNNSAASIVMRVNNRPSVDTRLRFDLELAPMRIEFIDLTKPKKMPIREDLIEAYLKPVIRKKLISSPLWKDESTKADARNEGEEAEMKMRELSLNTMGHNLNKVGTPRNF